MSRPPQKFSWVLACGLALASLACAFTPKPQEGLRSLLKRAGCRTLAVSRDRSNHKLFLKGDLGKQRIRVEIDTGAPLSCLSRALTNGVERGGHRLIAGQLLLDGVPFNRVPVVWADIHATKRKPECDFILGYEFLGRNHAVIEAGKRPELFVSTERPDPAVTQAMEAEMRAAGYQSLELLEAGFHWAASGRIRGRPVNMIVDTRAHMTVLTVEAARRIGVAKGPLVAELYGLGMAQTECYQAAPQTIEIAGLRFDNSNIGIADMHRWGLQGNGEIDGLLAADFLERAQAVIDCGNLKLYLRGELPKHGQ